MSTRSPWSRRRASWIRWTFPTVAVVCGLASIVVVRSLPGSPTPTAYAAVAPAAAVADLVAGVGLLAAGCLAHLSRPDRVVGRLAVLAGVAWLAADGVGWEDGPSLVRSMATVAVPFLLPVVAHLAAVFPGRRLADRRARALVALAYGAVGIAGVGGVLVRDPFLDEHCWSNCTDNAFLVTADDGTASVLDRLGLGSAVALGSIVTLTCVRRLARATPAARPMMAGVLVPAALVAVAEAAHAGLLLSDPAEDPEGGAFLAAFAARASALAALAVGVAWSVLRTRRARRSVARLADELGATPPPGSLRSVLARSLGDDRLEVAYWLPSEGRYADATGRPVVPRPGPAQTATAIVRGDEPVAVVVHDRAVGATHDLEREIGAAARLAVDNERLRAETLVQLEELRASRARVVDHADHTRRQLERDLHDGAQQTLLAMSFELRLALSAASQERASDPAVAARLAEASGEAAAAFDELRELAHGIYPAILAEAGLGPGLWTLAAQAPLPLEIAEVVDGRYPPGVESAAYLTVASAVDDATRRSASHVAVWVVAENGNLVIEARHDGAGSTGPPEPALHPLHLADRVGALGGRVTIGPDALRVEIPCG